jgi:hypothetical protein
MLPFALWFILNHFDSSFLIASVVISFSCAAVSPQERNPMSAVLKKAPRSRVSKVTSIPVPQATKAQMIASNLAGTGESHYVSAARPVLLRIPEHLLAQVDAMAKIGKKSRNAMAIELLDLAVDSVRETLPENVLANLDKQTIEELAELISNTTARVSSGD